MATLSADQLAELRRKMASRLATVDYNKPIINSALQAIEDWFEANRAGISGAIDTATAPYTFTAPRKKALVAFWLLQKYGREA
jgi:hypothetical protein